MGAEKTQVEQKVQDHLKSIKRLDTWAIKIHADGTQGRNTLDLLGAYYGRPFWVELKAPDKEPTPTQWALIARCKHGGYVSGYADSLNSFIQLFEVNDAA